MRRGFEEKKIGEEGEKRGVEKIKGRRRKMWRVGRGKGEKEKDEQSHGINTNYYHIAYSINHLPNGQQLPCTA